MSFWKKLFGKDSQESAEFEEIEKIVAGLIDAMQKGKWQPYAVETGKKLYKLGGRNYMMIAYALIESHSGGDIARALSLCWDTIGGWNGATGNIQIQNKGDKQGFLSKVFKSRVEQVDINSWHELNMAGAQALQDGNEFEAIRLLQDAVDVAKKTKGRSPELGSSLTNLAVAFERTSNYEKAGKMFEQALKIIEETRGKNHLHTASVLNLMSQYYFRRGDEKRALSMIKRADAIEKSNSTYNT